MTLDEEMKKLKEELIKAYGCLQGISDIIYMKSGISLGPGKLNDLKRWKELLIKIEL